MHEKEATLPVSKGTVWLRTRLSDGRMDEYESAYMKRLPREALDAILTTFGNSNVAPDADPKKLMRLLQLAGFNPLDLADGSKQSDRDRVLLVVKRWAGVHGPEDDAELLLTMDGLRAMDPDDFAYLVKAVELAVEEGRADPNAGAGSSGPISPRAGKAGSSRTTSSTRSRSTASVG